MTPVASGRISRRLLVILFAALLCGALLHQKLSDGRRPRVDNRIVVCIDAGHPSECNTGMTPQHGTTETKINWAVAQRLRAVLERDPRIRVVQPRRSMMQYMRNSRRATLAGEAGADFTVHLHCDAGPARGYTIYYPDQSAHMEGRTGPSPEVLRSSRRAALAMKAAMASVLEGRLKNRGVRGESTTYYGSRFGGLTVSVFSECPTVTVEMVFLSNPLDAAFIKTEAGQRRMAEALARGIREFLGVG